MDAGCVAQLMKPLRPLSRTSQLMGRIDRWKDLHFFSHLPGKAGMVQSMLWVCWKLNVGKSSKSPSPGPRLPVPRSSIKWIWHLQEFAVLSPQSKNICSMNFMTGWSCVWSQKLKEHMTFSTKGETWGPALHEAYGGPKDTSVTRKGVCMWLKTKGGP